MPINAEFLKTVLSGDGEADAKIAKIMTEYEVDLNGLKTNRDTILREKETLGEKLKALEAEKSGFDAKVKDLEDKIKKAGSEDTKAFYEAELKKATEAHAAELTKLQGERDSALAEASRYIANDEFSKAIKDLNIRPELRDDLRDVLYARNKFERKTIDGEAKYLNGESRNVKDVLGAYLQTDAGKAYLVNGNSGGGAGGSKTPNGAGGKTIKRADFDALEPAAQAQTIADKVVVVD